MGVSFRHSAGFGRRMEYNLVGKMLMEKQDELLIPLNLLGSNYIIKSDGIKHYIKREIMGLFIPLLELVNFRECET